MLKAFIRELLLKIDNFLFASYKTDTNAQQVLHEAHYQLRQDPYTNQYIDEKVATFFSENRWELKEYVVHYSNCCTIDPLMGWAFTKKFQFIAISNYNRFVHREKLRLPSFLKYKFGKKRVTKLKTITPLFYGWNNYFHFYNDIIGVIHLAKKLNITTTFLLPDEINTENYYHQYLKLAPEIAGIDFYIVERTEYIQADSAYFINTYFSHIRNFEGVRSYINWELIHQNEPQYSENVYISRPQGNRGFANQEAVEALLRKYHFTTYSLDENFPVEAQIQLFAKAKNIITIHGAALTNLIFSTPQQTKVIELFSKHILNPCYWWICVQHDLEYAAIFCDATQNHPVPFMRDLIVDIPTLEARIKDFMKLPAN